MGPVKKSLSNGLTILTHNKLPTLIKSLISNLFMTILSLLKLTNSTKLRININWSSNPTSKTINSTIIFLTSPQLSTKTYLCRSFNNPKKALSWKIIKFIIIRKAFKTWKVLTLHNITMTPVNSSLSKRSKFMVNLSNKSSTCRISNPNLMIPYS